MKQLIAILLIAGALLAFAGCHEEVPNETVLSDKYTDNYIYTFIDSVFSRVNVLTGSVTNVCPSNKSYHRHMRMHPAWIIMAYPSDELVFFH